MSPMSGPGITYIPMTSLCIPRLTSETRERLCRCLDSPNSRGDDWRLLAQMMQVNRSVRRQLLMPIAPSTPAYRGHFALLPLKSERFCLWLSFSFPFPFFSAFPFFDLSSFPFFHFLLFSFLFIIFPFPCILPFLFRFTFFLLLLYIAFIYHAITKLVICRHSLPVFFSGVSKPANFPDISLHGNSR